VIFSFSIKWDVTTLVEASVGRHFEILISKSFRAHGVGRLCMSLSGKFCVMVLGKNEMLDMNLGQLWMRSCIILKFR